MVYGGCYIYCISVIVCLLCVNVFFSSELDLIVFIFLNSVCSVLVGCDVGVVIVCWIVVKWLVSMWWLGCVCVYVCSGWCMLVVVFRCCRLNRVMVVVDVLVCLIIVWCSLWLRNRL